MPASEGSTPSTWRLEYERHLQDLTLSRLRVASVIAVLVVLLDGTLQFLFTPQLPGQMFGIRFVVSLMILVILGLTYLRAAFRVAFALSFVGTSIVAGDIQAAIAINGAYHSAYQTGYALLIVAVGLLFPYSAAQMAVVCVFVWVIYLLPGITGWQPFGGGGSGFYINSFFLLCSSLIAVTGCYVISRLQRHEFVAQLALKETFGKYVAREVRDEVLSGHIPLDGEKKNVTVLFSDLRDFTPMTESLDPKVVIKIMNSYFKEMSEAIRDQGGLVLQFIGDEIYAVFGAPVPRPDHPNRAFRAGLAMKQKLVELNRQFAERGWPSLRHGIGVHTGEALAANIGSPDRLSYLLVGDTINVASRLQSLTKEAGVEMIVSGATYAALTDTERMRTEVRDLRQVHLKGKSTPVDLFVVI